MAATSEPAVTVMVGGDGSSATANLDPLDELEPLLCKSRAVVSNSQRQVAEDSSMPPVAFRRRGWFAAVLGPSAVRRQHVRYRGGGSKRDPGRRLGCVPARTSSAVADGRAISALSCSTRGLDGGWAMRLEAHRDVAHAWATQRRLPAGDVGADGRCRRRRTDRPRERGARAAGRADWPRLPPWPRARSRPAGARARTSTRPRVRAAGRSAPSRGPPRALSPGRTGMKMCSDPRERWRRPDRRRAAHSKQVSGIAHEADVEPGDVAHLADVGARRDIIVPAEREVSAATKPVRGPPRR